MNQEVDKIGIRAPYGCDEATRLACSLGDMLRTGGRSVDYLAIGPAGAGVHPYWDSRVRAGRRLAKFSDWAAKHSHIIWFDVRTAELRLAQRQRNILVLLWQRVPKTMQAQLLKYSELLIPSSHLSLGMHRFLRYEQRQHLIWDCGHRFLPRRRGLITAGAMRLLVHMDSATIRESGVAVLALLQMLLWAYSGLSITLLHDCRWPRTCDAALREISAKFGERLALVSRLGIMERAALVREHDWTFCPSLYPNTGYDALESLQLGVPVIVFDLPPYHDFVRTGYNGVVLPTEAKSNWLGAPQVRFNPYRVLEQLVQILADEHFLIRLQNGRWHNLEQYRQAFRAMWQIILD